MPLETTSPSRRRWAIVLTSVGAFVAFLDVTIVNIAFPDIYRSFPNAGISELSWVLNAYNIVFAALLIVAGRLADLLGRRRLYVAGLAVFTLASALCALAGSPGQLIAARVLQATGAAVIVPSSLALLLPLFEHGRRATAVAIWTAVAAVASGIGPSLGGLLVQAWDWRAVFLVNVPVGLLAVPLARFKLAESRERGGRVPDVLGSAELAGAVGALALGIVKGSSWGWTSPRVLGCFAAASLLGALAARRVRRHPSPIVDPELMRVSSFASANVASLLLAASFYAAILCNVLFLTGVWRLSMLQAGLAVTPAPAVAAVTAALSERIERRFGSGTAAPPGAALIAVGVGWFALVAGPERAFLAEWLPGMVLVGAGVGLAFPALGHAALSAVPEPRLAVASAVNATARQIGAVIGIAILVAILAADTAITPALFARGWMFCAVVAGSVSVLTAVDAVKRRARAAFAAESS